MPFATEDRRHHALPPPRCINAFRSKEMTDWPILVLIFCDLCPSQPLKNLMDPADIISLLTEYSCLATNLRQCLEGSLGLLLMVLLCCEFA